jgi:hypothetical protein
MPSRLRHGIRRYLRLALFEAQSLLFLLYIFNINGRSYFSTFPHIQLSVFFVPALVPAGCSQNKFENGPNWRYEDALDCEGALGNT